MKTKTLIIIVLKDNMDITLVKNLKRLPDELVNYIIFMANPRMSYVLQKELHLEATHIMCEQHYNWWYPKLARYWHLNDVETMYEIPKQYHYGNSLRYYFEKEELKFIIKQLSNCGCCERHSKGIIPNVSHCLTIRENQSIRARIQMKNHYGDDQCTCSCRHILRNIQRLKNKV